MMGEWVDTLALLCIIIACFFYSPVGRLSVSMVTRNSERETGCLLVSVCNTILPALVLPLNK